MHCPSCNQQSSSENGMIMNKSKNHLDITCGHCKSNYSEKEIYQIDNKGPHYEFCSADVYDNEDKVALLYCYKITNLSRNGKFQMYYVKKKVVMNIKTGYTYLITLPSKGRTKCKIMNISYSKLLVNQLGDIPLSKQKEFYDLVQEKMLLYFGEEVPLACQYFLETVLTTKSDDPQNIIIGLAMYNRYPYLHPTNVLKWKSKLLDKNFRRKYLSKIKRDDVNPINTIINSYFDRPLPQEIYELICNKPDSIYSAKFVLSFYEGDIDTTIKLIKNIRFNNESETSTLIKIFQEKSRIEPVEELVKHSLKYDFSWSINQLCNIYKMSKKNMPRNPIDYKGSIDAIYHNIKNITSNSQKEMF